MDIHTLKGSTNPLKTLKAVSPTKNGNTSILIYQLLDVIGNHVSLQVTVCRFKVKLCGCLFIIKFSLVGHSVFKGSFLVSNIFYQYYYFDSIVNIFILILFVNKLAKKIGNMEFHGNKIL